MRIAVLGGSFDPIHHGHLVVAGIAREALGAVQVRLVPAGEQPFKVGQHAASANHRATMVELAVEGEPALVADRVEVDRVGPSYTVDTIADIRRRFPEATLCLLLGSDAAALFGTWRAPDQIRAHAEIVVFARGGESVPEGVADRVLPVPRIEISSTTVRSRVRSGQSIRYWVPDQVARYIETHRLYRDA